MSWYLDLVCPGWECLVEDDYTAVLPLTANKKYGIWYLFQPHFAQQLGIFANAKIEKSIVEKFLTTIPAKFRFIEICINTENSEGIAEKEISGFSLKKNSNYELDLNKTYDELYKNYSDNTKRNIRKGIASNASVAFRKIGISELIKLFKRNKGKEFSNLKNDYYQLLTSLIEAFTKKKLVKIVGAFKENGKLCGGAVFIIYKKRALFLFSATDEEAKKSRTMFFLIDKFISEHAESLAILDFEGSNNSNLARFYKSFGAKEYVYLHLKKNNLPKYIQWLKK